MLKDVEDLPGDVAAGRVTLPARAGAPAVRLASALLLVTAGAVESLTAPPPARMPAIAIAALTAGTALGMRASRAQQVVRAVAVGAFACAITGRT